MTTPPKSANRIFNLICIILTIYSIIHQVEIYLRNEDMSAVSSRLFKQDQTDDNYPTYTFCFEDSDRGDMYLKYPKGMGMTLITHSCVDEDCPYYRLDENKLFCSNSSGNKERTKRFGKMRTGGKRINIDPACERINKNDTKMYQYYPIPFMCWNLDGEKYLISTDHYRNLLMGKKQKYIDASTSMPGN